MTIPSHLGGNLPGGDPATWYPELWEKCVGELGVKSVLDVGCGDGVSTNFFKSKGAYVYGVDGVPSENSLVHEHDFATGPWKFPYGKSICAVDRYDTPFDLVWCCEFVEHVEEQYRDNFAPALQAGNIVLMTHAFPGQGGHHHVNCRNPEYWANWMGILGFDLDEDLTALTRHWASSNTSPWNHYVRSGLAFRKHVARVSE